MKTINGRCNVQEKSIEITRTSIDCNQDMSQVRLGLTLGVDVVLDSLLLLLTECSSAGAAANTLSSTMTGFHARSTLPRLLRRVAPGGASEE